MDPWGLERSAEATPELHPDVNFDVEKQRHVWLIREAAKCATSIGLLYYTMLCYAIRYDMILHYTTLYYTFLD